MLKVGDEQWALMPQYGQSNLTAGTYYVLVASQGQDLTNNNCLGSGSASYQLSSGIEPVTVLPNTLSYGSDLVFTNTQAGGELKFYQFDVPPGIASIEVRAENRVGNPVMDLNREAVLISPYCYYCYGDDVYGNHGGTNYAWREGSLITVANPNGVFSLTVYASSVASDFPNSSYEVR